MVIAPDIASVTDMRLRFAMPAAICSYCLSEMRIGARYQKGNVKKADLEAAMDLKLESENAALALTSLSLTPGRDKTGMPEKALIHFKPGEITALLGPTGAGKSRFLGDIESLAAEYPHWPHGAAQRRSPDEDTRFELQGRLVAQLTQNMNFVLDMGVMDFLRTHALSREVADPGRGPAGFEAANELAGRPFYAHRSLPSFPAGNRAP